ncbi:MAG: hypothetical protein PHO32_02480, partial [Candidatus Cloacimonetes bacterium]|nr:hypothetical protein [Candidatus Cloacimonadota bacterium]
LAGIELPEPNEIEMLSSESFDLRSLLRSYCDKHQIKISSIDEIILHNLSGSEQLNNKELAWYEHISFGAFDCADLKVNMAKTSGTDQMQEAFHSFRKVTQFSYSALIMKLMTQIKIHQEDTKDAQK